VQQRQQTRSPGRRWPGTGHSGNPALRHSPQNAPSRYLRASRFWNKSNSVRILSAGTPNVPHQPFGVDRGFHSRNVLAKSSCGVISDQASLPKGRNRGRGGSHTKHFCPGLFCPRSSWWLRKGTHPRSANPHLPWPGGYQVGYAALACFLSPRSTTFKRGNSRRVIAYPRAAHTNIALLSDFAQVDC